MEIGLNLLFNINVLLKFWVDAFLTYVYLINCLTLSSIDKDTLNFKIFGKHCGEQGP